MSRTQKFRDDAGFTLIGFLVAFVTTATFALLVATLVSQQSQLSKRVSAVAAKDRILAGVRSLAANPAALRNSMQAATNAASVNPGLLSCAGGNPANSCKGNTLTPLTLYSPIVNIAADGTLLGVQAITSPDGSTNPTRFDIWGAPCVQGQANCPMIVTTSFTAMCAPAQLSAAQLAAVIPPAALAPQALCTVADTIEVTYTVALDPNQAKDPDLASLIAPMTGTVSTSVLLISGNSPQ